MDQMCINILTLMLIAMLLPFTYASNCEETETSHVKLDLAEESINRAKLLYPKCEDSMNNKTNCSLKDRSLAYLNVALDLISEAKSLCRSCPETKVVKEERPIDCTEVQSNGHSKSGVYTVWPKRHGIQSNTSLEVYCDMVTDGGGWTVIQRRGDFGNKTSFYEDWDTYKRGFGNILEEFWIGNDNIFLLTNQGSYSARFDLVDVNREYGYAAYDVFSIGDEQSRYVLNVQNYTGNATNAFGSNHKSKFSTKDKQNDNRESSSACAKMYQSAFWFYDGCGYVNLNGVYLPGVTSDKSIWWFTFKNRKSYEGLYSAEIKIRRNASLMKR